MVLLDQWVLLWLENAAIGSECELFCLELACATV